MRTRLSPDRSGISFTVSSRITSASTQRVRDSVIVTGLDREPVADGVGDGDDRALVVGEQASAAGDGRAFVPEDGVVGSGAVDVAVCPMAAASRRSRLDEGRRR